MLLLPLTRPQQDHFAMTAKILMSISWRGHVRLSLSMELLLLILPLCAVRGTMMLTHLVPRLTRLQQDLLAIPVKIIRSISRRGPVRLRLSMELLTLALLR